VPDPASLAPRVSVAVLLAGLLFANTASAQRSAAAPRLGAQPPAAAMPRAEFVFEEHVTLAPAVVQGETALGQRQYIPITGGTIDGPKLKGEVIPGGWDYQLRHPGGCTSLSADYFLRAADGTIIHVLNQAFNCATGASGERSWAHPSFEAPSGSPYEWMTRGTFVASIEVDPPTSPVPPGGTAPLTGIRIKFYQIK
jgi:Protein of unknown function (DUF3237)